MKRLAAFITVLVILTPNGYAFAESGENLAQGAFVEAFAWDKSGDSIVVNTFNLKKLVDGNDYSIFQTPAGVERAEFVMDLYTAPFYNRVCIKEAYSTVLEFNLAVSRDKKSWTNVYSGQGISPYGKTINFPSTNSRYIRLAVTKTNNKYEDAAIAISNWQVYSDNTLTSEDLKNAVYLAKIKQQLLSRELLEGKFEDKVLNDYDTLIAQSESILENKSSAQEQLDIARDNLEKMTAFFEGNMTYTEKDYEAVRMRYFNNYTGNLLEKTSARLSAIENQGNTAKRWRDSIIRNPRTNELWEDLIPPKANFSQESGKVADSFARIRQMAVAYKQEGNVYYQDEEMLDDIRYCLNFLLKNKYRPGIEIYSNWYPWLVSDPNQISDILVLLRGDLSEEMVAELKEAVEYYLTQHNRANVFHMTWSGANRLYIAAWALRMGAATHDEYYIYRTIYALQQECLYRNTQFDLGDINGFYWDGSFIFHDNFMTNATYGRDQMNNTGLILNYLAGTPWQVEQATIDDTAKRLEDGFIGILYKGRSFDLAAARGLGQGISGGKTITNTIQSISDYFPEPQRSKFLSIVKQFKIDQGLLDDPLVLNEEIEARGDVYKINRYPIADKLIGHFGDWALGIAMVSDRTKTHESTNGDAAKAWYVGSGMVYILNDDTTQYDRDYWIAVDHYRLPGITVDLVPRTTTRFEGEVTNPNNWVASIDYNERFGIAGMETFNWNSSMSGKKSWFIFDNSVVAMGSNIRGGRYEIQTIVDNRILKEDASNKFLINGSEFENSSDTTVMNVKTAHIQGNTDKSDVGYFFPDSPGLIAVKEQRVEREADMWLGDSTRVVTANFAKLWFNHGQQPDNAKYTYVILPNMSADEVENYANAEPDFEILAQNNIVHAVRNKRLGLAGYNFWQKSGGSVDGVTVDGDLIMMTHEDDKKFEISLTDPTFRANRPKVITFDNISIDEILETGSNIKVLNKSPLKISVDLKNINGRKVVFSAAKTGGNGR